MTIWRPQSPPIRLPIDQPLEPQEVLFFYDEPLIFTSEFLSTPVLCYKYAEDEDETHSYYITTTTNIRLLTALKSGSLSIRGALSMPACWILMVGSENIVEQCWTCSFDEVPESALPERNTGLRSEFGSVPDQITIRSADAPFLSVNFLARLIHQFSGSGVASVA